MKLLPLVPLFLVLSSCATVSEIPGTDPDWIYGQGDGATRTEAEQAARDDLLTRALQERGGNFVREEVYNVRGGSGAPTTSYAVQLRQRRVGELPPLVPQFSAKLDTGRWRTIYRVARADWSRIETAHQQALVGQLAAEWSVAAAPAEQGAPLADRLEALLRLAARLEAEGLSDLELPTVGVRSLRVETERLGSQLTSSLNFVLTAKVPVVTEGQTWRVRVVSGDRDGAALAGLPVVWERALRPSGPWKAQTAVTGDQGTAEFTVQADEKERNRLWYGRLRLDYQRTLGSTLAARLDAKTSHSLPLRHVPTLATLFPDLASVKAGTAWVGSGTDDPDAEPDEPSWHAVETAAFAVQTTAVTMDAWRVYLDLNPAAARGNLWLDSDAFSGDRKPVVGITWAEANAYTAWLSQFGVPYRLPTETEREVFARAGSPGRFPWGDQAPSTALAQYQETGVPATLNVDALPHGKNALGLWSVSGNVWEWTSSEGEGILGAKPGWKAVKGGSWNSPASDLRLSNRRAQDPAVGRPDTGFRLVREENP